MAASSVVLLGNIQFVQREVPDIVHWGGKQILAIHRELGGNRVIDAMGPDPLPIKWSGKFYGPDAAQRARAADQLRQSGSQVQLTWGSFSYQVVVSEYEADYKHEWEVSYTITCEVVSDSNAQAASVPSPDAAIAGDGASIDAISDATPAVPATPGAVTIPSAMTTAISNAEQALATAVGSGSISDLSLSQLQPVIAAYQAAYTTVAAGSGVPAGIDLDAASGASTLDGIASFVTEAGLVANDSDVHTVQGYLGRIVGNLMTMGG